MAAISDLSAVTTLADADLLVTVDDTDATTKKITAANVEAYINTDNITEAEVLALTDVVEQDESGGKSIAGTVTIADLDLGTPTTGDIGLVHGSVYYTSGAATLSLFRLDVYKVSGTGVLNFSGESGDDLANTINVSQTLLYKVNVNGFFEVTTGGTVVLRFTANQSGAQAGTIADGRARLSVCWIKKQ